MYCVIVPQTQKSYVNFFKIQKQNKKPKFAKVAILKRRECPDPTFYLCAAIVYISHSAVVNMAVNPAKRKLPGTDGNSSIEKHHRSLILT